jgi:molybdenum cofactor synthesis domain-containing protein
MDETAQGEVATAAVLVIGDEVLSGRTRDRNIGHIATVLSAAGVDLKEARIVADDEVAIVEALNALRARYTYVFTTGGIGPTHDDITADSVARAFGVSIDHDPRAVALLEGRYGGDGLNEARLRMARIPAGADLIDNPVSAAPGFRIGNVFVMAGVPSIMQAMLDGILPQLRGAGPMLSREVETSLKEGDLAADLGEVQKTYPDVPIGSYPQYDGNRFWTRVVLRSRDMTRLEAASLAVEEAVMRASAAISRAETGQGETRR